MQRFISFIFCWIILGLLFPSSVSAYYTNMPANVVVGQADFTSSSSDQGGSVGANTLDTTLGTLIVDNKLLIADFGNSRVLIFNSVPSTNNASADIVIGQANMSGSSANQGGTVAANTLRNPSFLASDGQKLVVSDAINNRVLIFNSVPTTNNASANVVVGQSVFDGVSSGTGNANMNNPRGVAIYDGKLFVADEANNRILIWNTVPTTNGVAADVVLSKASSTSNFTSPYQLSVENGKLAIADRTNNRIFIWNFIPTVTDTFPDVVIGQNDFTTTTSTPVSNSKLSNPRGVYLNNGRVYIADRDRNRILVFNSIPTSNGAAADLVIGQVDFTSGSANGGGSASSNVLSAPFGVMVHNNQLFVSEISNHRLLIFNNVLSGPHLNINAPVEANDGKIKVTGSVQLGERPRYSLQRMQANVNGQGFGNVSYLSGGRDDGTDKTSYDFYHEFEPWAGISAKDLYEPSKGYTLNLKASSFNAEEDNLFYFQPFQITSVSGNTLNIKLNKDHWDRIKSNLDSFEIQQKKGTTWTTLVEKVPLDPESITSTKSLGGEVRLVAKDKWGHRQETNSIKLTTGVSSYNPNFKFATVGFPLQINRITGVNSGIISTYMSMPKNTFFVSTTKPTFSGIAYSGSTVTILVTDPIIGRSTTFTTTTKQNSTWTLPLTLYSASVIDTWVTLGDKYTELPTFKLTQVRSEQ